MSDHDDWLEFLQGQTFISAQVANSQLEDGKSVICDLSTSGLIAVEGEEAESFMQNQFCNDVRLVTDVHSQLNGYCTPKGRLLALFRLFKHAGAYYCELPHERLAPTLKRLQMYVLMSKVKLHDASHELVRFGIAGEQAKTALQSLFSTLPEQDDDAITQDDITIVRIRGTLPRFMLVGKFEVMKNLWQSMGEDRATTPANPGLWHCLDIIAGIPQVVDATVEEFVPQMLNLQSINALSFKKGCYPGQEVVARMHYLGKQKKRMFLAHLDTVPAPTPGTALYASGINNEQSIGTIVSSCENSTGGSDILALLQIASAQTPEIHLGDQQKIPFHLKDLPYTVEVEGDSK